MEAIRVGLVGAGFAAEFHLDAIQRVYGVRAEVAGVASKTKESREAFGKKHDVRPYDSVEDMLDHIDVVDVVAPPYAHEPAMLAAARAGKGVIVEKPFTGYFGPQGAGEDYRADEASKEKMLDAVLTRLRELADTIRASGALFGYAENFVYAPSIQKERDILEKTDAQILRMTGEESHNGSGSPVYGIWRYSGGGSLMGKGCHPLGGMLYLKQVEGLKRNGQPIRPAAVSARTHQITRLPGYRDKGFIRTDYHDIEDYGLMHVVFDDGTVSEIMTCELVLGGIYDFINVYANNHRTNCRLSPLNLVETFNPKAEQYEDVYLIEKTSTKEGWSPAAADEHFTMGYIAEMQDFITCAATGQQPQSGLELALDSIATIYTAYLSAEQKGREVAVEQL
jgi:predicted dehydrogenase